MKINVLRNINSIVDASRFDSSNPTGWMAWAGLDKSSPYNRVEKLRAQFSYVSG
jgi:hypothetical protein